MAPYRGNAARGSAAKASEWAVPSRTRVRAGGAGADDLESAPSQPWSPSRFPRGFPEEGRLVGTHCSASPIFPVVLVQTCKLWLGFPTCFPHTRPFPPGQRSE